MIEEFFNGMITILLARFILNDLPHAAGLFSEPQLPTWYIKSKPPTEPYLYHHATYYGLKRIAQRWAIEAPADKQTISLTTDAGRFLSPLPFFAAVTVDGVIKMPLTPQLQEIAVPALYFTHKETLAIEARERGYEVYVKEQLPLEYKYILASVVHNEMFIDENEYTVIAKYLNLSTGSIMYIHPAKIKKFKSGLVYPPEIRSLEELVRR
jgi:hypothetical protein